MSRYALFAGCVIPINIPFIERIARDVLPKLDAELIDLDFSCCPYYGVREASEDDWLVTAARNLALAEREKLDILSLCNGCSQTLMEANFELKDNPEKLKGINKKLESTGLQYNGSVNVRHFMMLLDEKRELIMKLIKNPLAGKRIATHTGCHLLRPSRIIGYDNPENPVKFDEFIQLLGGVPVDYSTKALCCGSAMVGRDKEMYLSMMKDKLTEIKNSGAEMLAVCCPSCFLQYDRNQALLKSAYNMETVPVVHALQLLQAAFGDKTYIEMNRSKPNIII